jgi:hypothetical protein
MKQTAALLLVAMLAPAAAFAEEIKIATYNVEHFAEHFYGRKFYRAAATMPKDQKSDEMKQLIDLERKHNDEDNWEVAQVISDRNFNPDVIVFEECCAQQDLEYFNSRWMHKAYETVIVFPGNSGHEQYVGLMAKPGFKIVERKDRYYEEPDPVGNERGDRLFARGPAFCLIESPSGNHFWLGVTHQKSKSGNSVAVTEWRNREAKRTHAIMKELEQQGPKEVVLLGDMNDELGIQEFEDKGGGDSIANLLGPPADGFQLVTKPLVDAGRITYAGYFVPLHRSFIDHIIVSKEMTPHVEEVKVMQAPLGRVASDHYPVYAGLRFGAGEPNASTQPTTQPKPSDDTNVTDADPIDAPTTAPAPE